MIYHIVLLFQQLSTLRCKTVTIIPNNSTVENKKNEKSDEIFGVLRPEIVWPMPMPKLCKKIPQKCYGTAQQA
jgi:hypothetical protein